MVPWRRQSAVLQTPDNPLGYKLPELDENSDWAMFVCEFDDEDCTATMWNEVTKRFIRQVQESRGYDVDCFPPSIFRSPFFPLPSFTKAEVKRATEFVMGRLNTDTPDKTYKLVEVKRVVANFRFRYMLMTFTVKEVGATNADAEEVGAADANAKVVGAVDADAGPNDDEGLFKNYEYRDSDGDGDGDGDGDVSIITYQATVNLCPVESEGYKLIELRIKPVPDATAA